MAKKPLFETASRGDKAPRGYDGLTERERKYVELYTTDFHGRNEAAAIAAGYPKKTIRVAVNRLNKHPAVQSKIKAVMAPAIAKAELTRDELVAKLATRFREPEVTNSDLVRLGKLIAEMLPGALVPVGLKVTGMTLEDFIKSGEELAKASSPDETPAEPETH